MKSVKESSSEPEIKLVGHTLAPTVDKFNQIYISKLIHSFFVYFFIHSSSTD